MSTPDTQLRQMRVYLRRHIGQRYFGKNGSKQEADEEN